MMEKRTKMILLTHGSWGEELWKAGEMIVGRIRFCKALGLQIIAYAWKRNCKGRQKSLFLRISREEPHPT